MIKRCDNLRQGKIVQPEKQAWINVQKWERENMFAKF